MKTGDTATSPFGFYKTADNLSIRHGRWRSDRTEKSGTIILLTGRREFMEKYDETITELNQRGFDVYSLDWRGQGLSGRQLSNRHKSFVESYDRYLEDLSLFMKQVIDTAPGLPLIMLAHSMGAHIGLRYIHDNPGIFERAVLTAAMIDISPVYAPRWLLRFSAWVAGRMGLEKGYTIGSEDYSASDKIFTGNRLTSDRERFMNECRAIAENPELALGGVTYGWLRATIDSIDILMKPDFAAGIDTSILMISAGEDVIVSNTAHKEICSRMPACLLKTISGSRHEILNETDAIRSSFWREFDRFNGLSRMS